MKNKFNLSVISVLIVIGFTSCLSTPQTPQEIAETHRARGWEFYQNRNFSRALEEYNTAIEMDSTVGDFFFQRGHIHRTMGNGDLALSDYQRSVELTSVPVTGNNVAFIGEIYFDNGDFDTALVYYNRAISINAENQTAIAGIRKIETARAEALARVELQNTINAQFGTIDKALYEDMGTGAGMMAMLGMGSPFQVGRRYKAGVITGMNTQYGATFTDSITGFVDPQKRVPAQLIGYDMMGDFIYISLFLEFLEEMYI